VIWFVGLDEVDGDCFLLEYFWSFVVDYHRCIHFQIIRRDNFHPSIREPFKLKHIQRSNIHRYGIIIPAACFC
jgi:hypothetical protein